jgi:hypothetical protein
MASRSSNDLKKEQRIYELWNLTDTLVLELYKKIYTISE